MIVAARPVVRRVEPGERVDIFRRLRRRIGRPDRRASPAPTEPPVDQPGDREVRLVVRVRPTTEDEAEREFAHSATVDLEANGVVDGEF